MALNSEEIIIDLIVTNEENGGQRASLVKKILQLTDNEDIKVVEGEERSAPFVVPGFKEDNTIGRNYIEEIRNVFEKNDKTYYLSIGALTNLSNFLKSTETLPNTEVVQMGGSEKRREHNFNLDLDAAQYVMSQDIKVTLITKEITNNSEILIGKPAPLYKLIQESNSEIFKLLFQNIIEFDFPFFLHDPLTLSYLIDERFLYFQHVKINLSEGINPFTCEPSKTSNIKISTKAHYKEFRDFVYEQFESINRKY